ncbi:hypothetical protein CPB84DRAFT_1776920 [Gymnopilus junonius]|uniref:Uncharacterized protein n=1 Tax=Gymnopilus junonius TaxID=109634 RepID=A0A9P5NLZ3_GYMJU|nr:hypothetical protein CPB84DRAFT_1776920 [Gymnopilus junonius]
MSSRTAYKGTRRRLVLAFDIGTTYSGISYSVLDPGQVPQIKGVTRFPAHEQISGASKIPTIIYYDRQGKVRAVGAEATREGIYEAAEDGNWIKAEWFKLHLRSKVGAGKNIAEQIPPLPLNKTVVEVFADFLVYLLECASSYIQDTHANGPDLWNSVKSDIDFVLSHPNGWEGKEQAEMRKAAVMAKLIPDTAAGHARVSFVTEGEASLHFAVQNGVLSSAMQNGEGIVIVDAGGGTVDVSSYTSNAKESYEEIAAPQCHFHGSVFVSIHARVFLEAFLEDSTFIDDLDHIIRCFDKTTKPRFRNADEPQYIKFGSTRDNDPQYNIRFGQLKLSGSDVAQFFEPSIKCIVNAVQEQRKTSHHKISHVVLVGGFAASDWLFNSVFNPLQKLGLNVVRPENHVNKAVSDGAISFYLDHFVRTRVSKVTYGSFCATQYDSSNPEHRARSADLITFNSGALMVNHYFAIILPKNTQVSETKEFRYSFHRESKEKTGFKSVESPVWCYRGENTEPKWKDIDTTNYSQLCNIVTDLSYLPLTPMTNPSGQTFYRVHYDIVLLFGLTEMKAQVAWKDKGVEKKGPAKIVYDPDVVRDDPQ